MWCWKQGVSKKLLRVRRSWLCLRHQCGYARLGTKSTAIVSLAALSPVEVSNPDHLATAGLSRSSSRHSHAFRRRRSRDGCEPAAGPGVEHVRRQRSREPIAPPKVRKWPRSRIGTVDRIPYSLPVCYLQVSTKDVAASAKGDGRYGPAHGRACSVFPLLFVCTARHLHQALLQHSQFVSTVHVTHSMDRNGISTPLFERDSGLTLKAKASTSFFGSVRNTLHKAALGAKSVVDRARGEGDKGEEYFDP